MKQAQQRALASKRNDIRDMQQPPPHNPVPCARNTVLPRRF